MNLKTKLIILLLLLKGLELHSIDQDPKNSKKRTLSITDTSPSSACVRVIQKFKYTDPKLGDLEAIRNADFITPEGAAARGLDLGYAVSSDGELVAYVNIDTKPGILRSRIQKSKPKPFYFR